MNRPLHLYMLELFTPYLFQDSYRRRTDQEHPSAKERSSVLKTLKTIGTMYISFPLKISKRRTTAANFSLNKDGGVFNSTMYIPFVLSCKNVLRIILDLFVVGNRLYERREESFLIGSVTKYIFMAECMRVISFPL